MRYYKPDEKYAEYIKAYPDIKPCIYCYYYRFLDGSEPYRKRKKYNNVEFRAPACHYSLETGHVKDYIPYDGTCKYFVPNDEIKNKKKKIYYPFKWDKEAELKKFIAKVDEFNNHERNEDE